MRKQPKRVLVKILNPIGERTHTSMRCAADMVQRGVAIYEQGLGIRLIDDRRLRLSHQAVEAANREREEVAITADRGGVFWWDGASPGVKAIPFTSSVYPRPEGRYPRSRTIFAESARKPDLERYDRSI